MKKFGRVDENQSEIVQALRKVGCSILSLAPLGDGCADLLVLRADTLYVLEVKDGNKPPSKRRLTPHQVKFHEIWPVHTVTSIETALKAVGL